MFSSEFKIAVVKEVFKEESAFGALHDVMLEVYGESPTESEAHLVFFQLPETIQCDALKWGLNDTEVRDQIYVHLQKVKDNV